MSIDTVLLVAGVEVIELVLFRLLRFLLFLFLSTRTLLGFFVYFFLFFLFNHKLKLNKREVGGEELKISMLKFVFG